MQINFEKWHACRNDFIIVWLDERHDTVFDSLRRLTPKLCSRSGDGVGADGLIVLIHDPGNIEQIKCVRIINADGSEALTCGNGLRCAALSYFRKMKSLKTERFIPDALEWLLKESHVLIRYLFTDSGSDPWVAINMGVPLINHQLSWYEPAIETVQELQKHSNIKINYREIAAASLPNPHIIFFADSFADDTQLSILAQNLQDKPLKDGCNVHWATTQAVANEKLAEAHRYLGSDISKEGYYVRSWERGVGFTAACGSGASCVAAVAFDSGECFRDEWLPITMPGGNVFIQQKSPDDDVVLAGDAVHVFEGFIDI